MIYLIHFLVINLLFIISKFITNKNFFAVASFIYSLFVFGQRWMTGTDFPHYLTYYITGFNRGDIGYFGLQEVFLSLDLYFGNFIFLIFLMTLGTVYYFINKFDNQNNLILYIYLLSELFFAQMSQLRQFVAIGFMLIAFYYAYKGINRKALVFTLIAASFHSTALLVIPFMLFKPKLQNKTLNILMAASIILPVIDVSAIFRFIPFISSYVDTYLGSAFDVSLGLFHYMRYYSTILLIFLFINRIDRKDSTYQDNLILNGLIVYILFYGISFQFAPLFRMANYFKIFEILYLVGNHKKVSGLTNQLMKTIIITFYLAIFVGSSIVDSGDIAVYQFRPLRIHEDRSALELNIEIARFRIEQSK